ncbi:L,D-transpeptidase family protein [Minwuia sp.]|uniref:L,D-transpeptidase family protein n=1 Tax=Minwuia sp. TaxID=2493630 RepID=UPI003A909431
MFRSFFGLTAGLGLILMISSPASSDDEIPTPAEIEAATYVSGPLPEGRTALTIKVQTLLDRAHVSPGVIDGFSGGMTDSAIRAFETREGLTADGVLDLDVWTALTWATRKPITARYRIEQADLPDNDTLPDDYARLATYEKLGYQRVTERLAERFHMDEDFLRVLNPQARFEPGETIVVINTGDPLEGQVDTITVEKASGRLVARDADGRILADYPVAVGSDQTPSPEGEMEVRAIAYDPNYTYDPAVNFKQGQNEETLILPPGPNGPVGTIWIDLTKPTYGIHGTPEPAKLFVKQSHGCVRMTNWDARELADMVGQGVRVTFAP